jgi:hypothetical protein
MIFKNYFFTLCAISILTSCNLKEKAKDGINAAGQAGGEAIKQVSQGVQQAFKLSVTLSPTLQTFISNGETKVANANNGTDNVLQWYVIFNTDFNQEVTAKIFNTAKQEKGRATIMLTGKKNEARFVDVVFDTRVNIDATDTIIID